MIQPWWSACPIKVPLKCLWRLWLPEDTNFNWSSKNRHTDLIERLVVHTILHIARRKYEIERGHWEFSLHPGGFIHLGRCQHSQWMCFNHNATVFYFPESKKSQHMYIYIYGWSFRPTLLVECLIARAFFLLRYLYMVWCCRLRQPRRTPVSSSWIHPLSAVWTKSGWSQLQTPTLWSVASQPKREPGPTQRPCIPPDDDDWVLQDLQPPKRHQQPAWDESCGRGWSRSR